MTVRERFSPTMDAVRSLLATMGPLGRLLFADTGLPPWLRDELAALQRVEASRMDIVAFDQPLWPHEVRARLAGTFTTDYVAFVDNDVRYLPGWLESLVRCADETGAGIVGPLYLWGSSLDTLTIHMAGGSLLEVPVEGGVALKEAPLLANADPAAVDLVRKPCDFVEYHCMLIRNELLRDGTLFDPRIRCVHEHIDTALMARKKGAQVYLEPSARVIYLLYQDYLLSDIPFYRSRWDPAEADASMAVFGDKWGIQDDPGGISFGGMRHFVQDHVRQVDPVPYRAADRAEAPMPAGTLAQTRAGLLDQAMTAGYTPADLTAINQAYILAVMLMNGGYRPCGRPFINHLVGTASVLVFYGFDIATVTAGLLHAVYTHHPPGNPDLAASIQAVSGRLGGRGCPLESRVRTYSLLTGDWQGWLRTHDVERLTLHQAEVLAIAAANGVDMHLSGESRYSGRPEHFPASGHGHVEQVCRVLGVPGLSASLVSAGTVSLAPAALVLGAPGSFRYGSEPGRGHSMARPVALLAEALSAP